MDKIQRPTGVRPGFDQDWRPCANGAPTCSPLTHDKAFLTVEPVNAVDPRGLALLTQQNEQPSIAEALPLVGQIAQLRPKFRVRGPA